jgi:hypothetical protein
MDLQLRAGDVSRLLGHPDFRIGHLVLMNTNGRECVVGVVGKLPIGALSIGQRRASDSHEFIVLRKKCSDHGVAAPEALQRSATKNAQALKKTRKEVTSV